MIVRHIKVIGRVQGIGYRRWAEGVANQMGLSGWVRNSSDGTVEIMVKGDVDVVNLFLKKCLTGPGFSMVLGIQPVTIPTSATPPIKDGTFQIIASV